MLRSAPALLPRFQPRFLPRFLLRRLPHFAPHCKASAKAGGKAGAKAGAKAGGKACRRRNDERRGSPGPEGRRRNDERRESPEPEGRRRNDGRRESPGPEGRRRNDERRGSPEPGGGRGGLAGLGLPLGGGPGGPSAADTYGACLLVRPGASGDMRGERLEFLGDAVLYLVAADLIHRSGDASVGTPRGMHAARAPVLRNDYLAARAREAGVDDLVASERARAGLPPAGPKASADATEALIGAIYRLEGYDAAAAWIARHVLPPGFPG